MFRFFTGLILLLFCSCANYNSLRIISTNGRKLFYSEDRRIRMLYYGDYVFDDPSNHEIRDTFKDILNNCFGKETFIDSNFLIVCHTVVPPFIASSIILKNKADLDQKNVIRNGFLKGENKGKSFFEKTFMRKSLTYTIRVYDYQKDWLIIAFSSEIITPELTEIFSTLNYQNDFEKYTPQSPDHFCRQLLKDLNYFKPVNYLKKIETNYQNPGDQLRLLPVSIRYNSYVKNTDSLFAKLKSYVELYRDISLPDLHQDPDLLAKTNQERLAKAIQNQKIIMVDNSDYLTSQRFLLTKHLKTFYEKGFSYLILDRFINENGLPEKDYDPKLANLLRQARLYNFEILYLDNSDKQNRNLRNAQKLSELINGKDSKAKFIYFSSLNNISFNPESRSDFISCFQTISGIQPFTISQKAYQFAQLPGKIKELFFKPEDINTIPVGKYDAYLVNNFEKKDFKLYPDCKQYQAVVDISEINLWDNEYLAQIYPLMEYEDNKKECRPCLNCLIKKEQTSFIVNLPQGSYQFILKDISNNIIYAKIIEII